MEKWILGIAAWADSQSSFEEEPKMEISDLEESIGIIGVALLVV